VAVVAPEEPVTHRYLPDRPAEVTGETAGNRHAMLAARVDHAQAAAGPDEWIALFDDWNHVKGWLVSEGARRRHRFNRDTRDAEAEAGLRAFREQVEPVADAGNTLLADALLASRHAEAVGAARGSRLLAVLGVARARQDPRNSPLRVEAGEILVGYDSLVSGGEVIVGGRTITLPRAVSLQRSADAKLRREAFLAHRRWFADRSEEIAAIYGRLVALRDRMGRNRGHDGFVPLGYDSMLRTDYGQDDVAGFRAAVLRHLSPLHGRVAARQARALGSSRLLPWDVAHDPGTSLPGGAAEPVAGQLDRAERAFERLSPRLAEHFRTMRRRELIDLANRPGKRPGAYCTTFPDEDAVAILCNSVGEADDVRALVHESGHAFQGWESQWIEPIDLRSPTADAAEVHSSGLELLAQPYLDEFFSPEHQERFAHEQWRRALDLLCYACVVDGFQHFVYENPAASPGERDAEWCRLHRSFLPGIDWDGHLDLLAARWKAQAHVFQSPFYYVDYAIAQCGALQLADLDARDHERALDAYLELCRLGGTKGVLDLFATAGLRSPFEEDVVAGLARHLAARLEA
jgi:M3 family oligoendopeptidase